MSRSSRFTVGAMLLAVVVGASLLPTTAQTEEKGEKPSAEADALSIGKPIMHGNLTIFPVISKTARNEDRFITLDQGLKNGTVVVLEMGAQNAAGAQPNEPPATPDPLPDGQGQAAAQPNPSSSGRRGSAHQAEPAAQSDVQTEQRLQVQVQVEVASRGPQVNRLLVLNTSGKPLYLMPGEIIMGGQQDRVIGQEIVIQSGDKPVPVDVFCVEHGRWQGRNTEETVAHLRQANEGSPRRSVAIVSDGADLDAAAKEANSGKFIASVGNVSKGARVALQATQDQGRVWEEVAGQNSRNGVSSRSGAFTSNYVDSESLKRLEPFLKALETPVAETSQAVGVIVAVNGKIDSMDVFESTPLFRKLWPKLLKSYALDAVNSSSSDGKKVAASSEDARMFCKSALEAKVEKSETAGKIAVTTRSTDDLVSFSASESEEGGSQAAEPMSGLGGVHVSAFAK